MSLKPFMKTLIALSLLPAFAYAADAPTKPMSPADKAQIQEVVHDYLMQKPEVIMEAVQSLQRKQMDQAQETVKKTESDAIHFANALFHEKADPIAGNPQGTVTLVEFFDYQCGHCVEMAPVLDAAIKANPNLRVIFKEFPIRGPMSEMASKAALAANKQGKYYLFHHALITSNQPLSEKVIWDIAAKTGLDVEKLKTDMKDSAINTQLASTNKLGQDLKLLGTPAFFIGKSSVVNNTPNASISYTPGQMNQNQLQDLIDKAK